MDVANVVRTDSRLLNTRTLLMAPWCISCTLLILCHCTRLYQCIVPLVPKQQVLPRYLGTKFQPTGLFRYISSILWPHWHKKSPCWCWAEWEKKIQGTNSRIQIWTQDLNTSQTLLPPFMIHNSYNGVYRIHGLISAYAYFQNCKEICA